MTDNKDERHEYHPTICPQCATLSNPDADDERDRVTPETCERCDAEICSACAQEGEDGPLCWGCYASWMQFVTDAL